MNINAQTYAFSGINMALDVIIFTLPIPQVSVCNLGSREEGDQGSWVLYIMCRVKANMVDPVKVIRLRMSIKRKIAITSMFAVGSL